MSLSFSSKIASASTSASTFAKLAVAAALATAVFNPTTQAQQSTPNPGTDPNNSPVQIISNSQFNQMVANGQLKENNPIVVLEQFVGHVFQDLKNGATVQSFMRKNPGIPGYTQLVTAAPKNPDIHPTLEGNYRTVINFNGVSQTIETFGPSTKLGQLATSITTSADPKNQLALYSTAYSQYGTTYNQLCNPQFGIPPGQTDIPPGQVDQQPSPCQTLLAPTSLVSPVALQGAPIGQIYAALGVISAFGPILVHHVPTGVGPGPVACNEELGSSFAPGVNGSTFGDQINSTGYTLSSSGLVANFNFPAKNMLTCIRNQGQRGTCHIFAGISAIEELIARDTGVYANLSEQDFMENSKMTWASDYYNDNGDAGGDLQSAQSAGYKFAFENTWDYNPAPNQPAPPNYEYVHSCDVYPSNEPGCSATAPEATQFCTLRSTFAGIVRACGLDPFINPHPSPYSSAGVTYTWYPSNKDLSVDYIFLALAFNNAVVLGFNATNNFVNTTNGFISYTAGIEDDSVGGHSVHIVGYVSNEDIAANPNTASAPPASGGGYFIIKNSWGAAYGDAGYSYMPVDYLKANAVDVAVVSSVNKN
ncbi:MAG TPA: C1 family peptidase [Candidatus Acidoferrum sp.]|jgi:C1A family cysteine protease